MQHLLSLIVSQALEVQAYLVFLVPTAGDCRERAADEAAGTLKGHALAGERNRLKAGCAGGGHPSGFVFKEICSQINSPSTQPTKVFPRMKIILKNIYFSDCSNMLAADCSPKIEQPQKCFFISCANTPAGWRPAAAVSRCWERDCW